MTDRTIQTRRGGVLLVLRLQHPKELARGQILPLLAPWYIDRDLEQSADLQSDLGYLEEKGLITIDDTRIGAVRLTTYRLTAAGVDVADGSVADPGIFIARRRH